MVDKKNFYDDEKLDYLVDQLELHKDNIFHVILSNGMEMMGELFPGNRATTEQDETNTLLDDDYEADNEDNDLEDVSEEIDEEIQQTPIQIQQVSINDYLFLNPVGIVKKTYVSPEGEPKQQIYFTGWNPCAEGPYTHITKSQIISMSNPKPDAMRGYLSALYDQYYSLLCELPSGDFSVIQETITLNHDDIFNKTASISNVIDFNSFKSKKT